MIKLLGLFQRCTLQPIQLALSTQMLFKIRKRYFYKKILRTFGTLNYTSSFIGTRVQKKRSIS